MGETVRVDITDYCRVAALEQINLETRKMARETAEITEVHLGADQTDDRD